MRRQYIPNHLKNVLKNTTNKKIKTLFEIVEIDKMIVDMEKEFNDTQDVKLQPKIKKKYKKINELILKHNETTIELQIIENSLLTKHLLIKYKK